MHATRISAILAAFAAACTPSSPDTQPVARAANELADLVVSASCRREEDALKLAIAVANRGRAVAEPSSTRVDVDGEPGGVVHRMRFIAAHAVDTFEVEMPAVCARADCLWKITVDSTNQVPEADEGNNTLAGRC